MGRVPVGGAVLAIAVVLLAGCSSATGIRVDAEGDTTDAWSTPHNDEAARTLAVALGSPRPTSAASLQRHIAALPAGRSGRVEVLEAVDLVAEELVDPLARMRWRVTTQDTGPWTTDDGDLILTCYDVEFNYYGAIEAPERVPCSPETPALAPPPALDPDPIGEPIEPCHSGSGDCGGGG